MVRSSCCSKEGLNRGAWTRMEDKILIEYVEAHGEGHWKNLPDKAGLNRCGKSCRLRWLNYLKPGIRRGNITVDEADLIIRLHNLLGNRWSLIAGRLPGRTDNEIKNYWNTRMAKKMQARTSSVYHRQQQPSTSNNLSKENPTPSLHQSIIPKPSSENITRRQPYVYRTVAARCFNHQRPNILIDQIETKQEVHEHVENNNSKSNHLESLTLVASGEYCLNLTDFLANFEMEETSIVDFLDADFSRFSKFVHNEENKNLSTSHGINSWLNSSETLGFSDEEKQLLRDPSVSSFLASEMDWI